MIHRQTFKDIKQQLIDQPEHIPELLLTLLNLNQAEIPTVINFNTASADAMNDLWWVQRLANRQSLPDDDVNTASIMAYLNRVQTEYWFQLQKLCRNSGFLSLEAFDKAIGAHQQAVTQVDVDDPQGLRSLVGFWNQFGEAIGAIMDNDDHYRYLDRFFKTQLNDAEIDDASVNAVVKAFDALKYHYVAKVMYLNHVYGNYQVPRVNFDEYRQRLEFVHDDFKTTLQSFFHANLRIINELISESNGADASQVTNVEALVDISNGLIPIDGNDARAFKSVLVGFDNMHKEFLFRQIQHLEQTPFLRANDFQPVFDYWDNCQTTEQRCNLSVFNAFFNKHHDQLQFLLNDFATYQFVDDFLLRHEDDYQQVRIADALELHDRFVLMKDLYLATVDVIKDL
ncbi:hypothetical protein ACYATP_04910 [Lactobacillaceae bacterium Melli_B4]